MSAIDRYLEACRREQWLADAWLAARLVPSSASAQPGPSPAARLEARAAARRWARALLGLDAEPGAPAPMLVRSTANVPVTSEALLDKLLRPVLPECMGYDLCAPEQCHRDALGWRDEDPARRRRAWVVGVRTGGSYYAPMWSAALDGHAYATVRPLETVGGAARYHAQELAELRDDPGPPPDDVVIVDDRPDTGATVLGLARALRSMLGAGPELWVASPGHVDRVEAGPRLAPYQRAPERLLPRPPRIWQWLREPDHPRLLERVRDHVEGLGGRALALRWATRELERRYEPARTFRPWNDRRPGDETRVLVNPRKTPFTIVDAQTDAPLLHARFVGEEGFGRAELERLRRAGDLHPEVTLLDGYTLIRHRPGLRSLADVRAAASEAERERLWLGAARYFGWLAHEAHALPTARGLEIPLRARLHEARRALERRIDGPLPGPPACVPETIGMAGPSGLLVVSSLSRAHPAWHWQVDPQGTVLRFHLDATWGRTECLELELASFALEQRLSPAELSSLLRAVDAPASADALRHGVQQRLGQAALLWLDTWNRSVRRPPPHAAARIHDELTQHWSYVDRTHRELSER